MKKYLFFFIFLISNCVQAQNKIFFAQNHTKVPASNPSQSYNALNFSTSLQNFASLPAATYFSGNFTIECWVYPTAHTNWSRIIDFGNGAGSNCVLFATSYGTSGKPGFYVGGAQFEATSQIPLNQWTHLAATLSGSTATIYINGIASGTANFTAPANVTRSNNYIGRSNWGWGDPAPDATFDDLRIWSVAKTEAEIIASMNNELIGTESNLVAYFKFNEGVACGNNTSITTLVNSAATGSQYNATLSGFTFNNSCVSNFVTGKLRPTNDGLTSATAGSSAYQIKQDFPASTDGLYWIKNANINSGNAFQIYADMTTDGGGWTLLLCNKSPNNGWTSAQAVLRNELSPTINPTNGSNDSYSIIAWADHIKRSSIGFQYMLDAQTRRSNGGIWTVNQNYSFVSRVNTSTDITLNTKFGSWNYADIGNTLQPRMPWWTNLSGDGFITTDDVGTGWWWGTLVTSGGWDPSPWIEAGPQHPGIIWYWVR